MPSLVVAASVPKRESMSIADGRPPAAHGRRLVDGLAAVPRCEAFPFYRATVSQFSHTEPIFRIQRREHASREVLSAPSVKSGLHAFSFRGGIGRSVERRFKVSISECSGPNTTDDDAPVTNRINNLPSTENELPPAAITQFVQKRASLRVGEEELRSVVNTKTDRCGRLRVTPGDVSNNRLNVCRSSFSPD